MKYSNDEIKDDEIYTWSGNAFTFIDNDIKCDKRCRNANDIIYIYTWSGNAFACNDIIYTWTGKEVPRNSAGPPQLHKWHISNNIKVTKSSLDRYMLRFAMMLANDRQL